MIPFSSVAALLASEAFNPIDRHFAELVWRLADPDSPELVLAAALASRRLADGHPCLALEEVAGRYFPETHLHNLSPILCPLRAEWERRLRETALVGHPGEEKPLILDDAGRLYLQRYWRYERAVADDILVRVRQEPLTLNAASLGAGLARLFPTTTAGETNWQRVAAFTAVRQQFCVITGGPGTGKTWTVARLLALLLEQPGGEGLRIRLAAPTGKAVARLQESLSNALADLQCPDAVKARLRPKDLTTTIHRLLGAIPNSVEFRHGPGNPLPVDVLVVDEASMVSLSLMAKLLSALKPNARLVLVGDKDQLPPVDPGGVLGDLCRAAAINRFSTAFCRDYQRCTNEALAGEADSADGGLADAVVQLRTNYRSGAAAALYAVSAAVNEGATAKVIELLHQPAGASSVVWHSLPQPRKLKEALRDAVSAHYGPVLKAASAAGALSALGGFRILCAVREGPYGTVAVNRMVEEILAEAGLAAAAGIEFGSYQGRPVMVTANNYVLKLFNGDTGVVWPDWASGSSLVHFPDEAGSIRTVARERLPDHETVYAMTIHKSQGSEFDHVWLILPDQENPVLTRELVYTALTRARKSVRLLATDDILRSAIQSRVRRTSGLSEALSQRWMPSLDRSRSG